MSKSRDIRGFFKPRSSSPLPSQASAPPRSQPTPKPSSSLALTSTGRRGPSNVTPESSSPLSSPPSSPPLPLRSPSPPRRNENGPGAGNRVIVDSEDELSGGSDDDSMDDILPSLYPTAMSKPAPVRDVPVPAPASRPRNPCVTPKAKRKAVVLPDFSSPLSVRPRHAFDFQTLLAHESEHQSMMAAKRQVDEEMMEDEDETALPADDLGMDSPRKFMSPRHMSARTRRKEIVQRAYGDGDRVARAERAMEKVNAGAERGVWYFFEPTTSSKTSDDQAPPCGPDFPASVPKTWYMLLGNVESRPRHLGSGAPAVIAAKAGAPDEVVEWILQQLPCERDIVCRDHYVRIILAAKDDQLARFITPGYIRRLFGKLGARMVSDSLDKTSSSEERMDDSHDELIPVVEIKNAYKGRDWSILLSILDFLQQLAYRLVLDPLVEISLIVLTLSADETAMEAPGVLRGCQQVILAVTASCPEKHWKEFRESIAAALFASLKESFLQVQVVNSLPLSTRHRPHELRKGLATVFLFDDPSLMTQYASTAHSAFLSRLAADDLKLTRQADYTDIRNIMWLWEAALDGGVRGTALGDSSDADAVPMIQTEPEFNEQVDELIRKVEFMQTSVKSAGAGDVARLQTKEYLEGLTSRLKFNVRTKPPKRRDHYDDAREVKREQERKERETGRQRNFMGQFLDAREGSRRERSPSGVGSSQNGAQG